MATWTILTDIIDDGRNTGKGTLATGETMPAGAETFRLLDDDGEVYFVGEIANAESGFEPLDQYGRAWGCTEIQYRKGAKWHTL